MTSEYDPLFPEPATDEAADLERVRVAFRAASRPFLSTPVSWLAWALALPAAALATPLAVERAGPPGVLLLWSLTILVAGAVEFGAYHRRRRVLGSSTLASFVLRIQGNLSLVAVVLSGLLIWQDLAWALPGLWLLLLGHSFFLLGGLTFAAFRVSGILYQVGGVAALWPGGEPLLVFAGTTAVANLLLAAAVWRRRRQPRGVASA